MRAVQFTRYGGPEVLTWGESAEPHPGPGQVRVRVRAASVNPIDAKKMTGLLAGGAPLEGVGVVGVDAAGVVDEVGDGVVGTSVGDEVFGLGAGTQAEYAVLRAWATKPPAASWAESAAVALTGETAERGWRLLAVPEGGTVFVDGGAGGVGSVAVQLAVARGLSVIASAGEGNQEYLHRLGARPVLSGEGVARRVRDIAAGPVDAVFDVVGKTPAEELVSLVEEPRRVLSIANFGAGQAGAQVTGGGEDSRPEEAMALVADLLARGALRVPVEVLTMDRAGAAYAAILGGHVRGKLVLVP